MSKLKFCPECGHKFEYKFAAPKFCPECGTATARAPQVDINRRKAPRVDDDEPTEVPHIEKLEATVEYDSNITTMDFNDKEGFVFKQKKFEKRSRQF